jgi:hypothetical protein
MATARFDPIAGRIPESRVGKGAEGVASELERWGSKPAAPASGVAWFEGFTYEPATLQSGLGTDRQWYALRYSSCLLRGFCDREVVREALRDEGVVPVGAFRHGRTTAEAMATLWFNVIHDSVCGTYHEVVLSFDVCSPGATDPIAFRERSPRSATWALQYANFGPSVCEAQFLHSLWIDSPLSIQWGREMQGFPKHPKPIQSRLDDDAAAFAFDLQWDGRNILRGRAAKRFGLGPFVTEGLGLVGAHGLFPVLGFLGRSSFDIPILMPVRTADQNGVPRRYLGHLWKGLDPFAVQVWPWGEGDVLEIGEVSEPTGCEEHNGNTLLRRAKFEPLSVTYLPNAAALVEQRP